MLTASERRVALPIELEGESSGRSLGGQGFAFFVLGGEAKAECSMIGARDGRNFFRRAAVGSNRRRQDCRTERPCRGDEASRGLRLI